MFIRENKSTRWISPYLKISGNVNMMLLNKWLGLVERKPIEWSDLETLQIEENITTPLIITLSIQDNSGSQVYSYTHYTQHKKQSKTIEEYTNDMHEYVQRVIETKESAVDFLQKAGVLNENEKLTEDYK
jgi:hypothetical protein